MRSLLSEQVTTMKLSEKFVTENDIKSYILKSFIDLIHIAADDEVVRWLEEEQDIEFEDEQEKDRVITLSQNIAQEIEDVLVNHFCPGVRLWGVSR